MVYIYKLFFFASESGLQHHMHDRGAETNSEEIDEDSDSEDDQENLVFECEDAGLEEEESTYETETDETTENDSCLFAFSRCRKWM